MYALGDKYDLTLIKETALVHFNKCGATSALLGLIESIPIVYSSTPDSDRHLRGESCPLRYLFLICTAFWIARFFAEVKDCQEVFTTQRFSPRRDLLTPKLYRCDRWEGQNESFPFSSRGCEGVISKGIGRGSRLQLGFTPKLSGWWMVMNWKTCSKIRLIISRVWSDRTGVDESTIVPWVINSNALYHSG